MINVGTRLSGQLQTVRKGTAAQWPTLAGKRFGREEEHNSRCPNSILQFVRRSQGSIVLRAAPQQCRGRLQSHR
jgi:hypothetical protein